MRVYFEVFRSGLISWQELFQQAADFASQVGAARLISIGHSEDQNSGVVTVWYWGDEEPAVETAEKTEPE